MVAGAALVSERRADHELEHVERDVGDDAEHPDGAGPRPADALDAAELPVGVHGDGRGHQLGGEEGEEQQVARPLDEGPAPGPRHEDERLADDAHLEVGIRGKWF